METVEFNTLIINGNTAQEVNRAVAGKDTDSPQVFSAYFDPINQKFYLVENQHSANIQEFPTLWQAIMYSNCFASLTEFYRDEGFFPSHSLMREGEFSIENLAKLLPREKVGDTEIAMAAHEQACIDFHKRESM